MRDTSSRHSMSRRLETLVMILLCVGMALLGYLVIEAGLYIRAATRQLERSDIKLDAMLEKHYTSLKDHERHEREQSRESSRLQMAFEAMLERQNRIWHELTQR